MQFSTLSDGNCVSKCQTAPPPLTTSKGPCFMFKNRKKYFWDVYLKIERNTFESLLLLATAADCCSIPVLWSMINRLVIKWRPQRLADDKLIYLSDLLIYIVYILAALYSSIYRVACVMMTDEREKRWITIGRVWCVSALSISATKVWRQCAAAITNDLMAWLERTKTSTWYCAAHRSFYSRAWVTHDRALRFCRERGRREKKNPFPSAFFEGSRTAHSTCYYASIVVKPLDCYRITMQRPVKKKKIEKIRSTNIKKSKMLFSTRFLLAIEVRGYHFVASSI